MVNEMLSKTENSATVFMKYMLYRGNEKIHHFFEGHDDIDYYCSKIRNFRNYHCSESSCVVPANYICGNKKNVVLAHKKIEEEFKDDFETKELLFFIDNDFEKNSSYPSNIYVTPYYSIENFYFEDYSLIIIFSNILKINMCSDIEVRKKIEEIVNELIEERNKFLNNLIPLNAWYSLQQEKATDEVYSKLNAFDSISNFLDDYSLIPKTLEDLKELTVNPLDVTEEEFEKEKKWIERELLKRCRGKYLEEFFYKKMKDIFGNTERYIGKRIENDCKNIEKKHFLTRLSLHTNLLPCLNKYLVDNLVS